MEPDRATIRRQLLAWYRARKRDLPFRRTKDPYAILVAETILQRTRVDAGLPYYERFLAAFPSVHDLAAASEADVLRVWEGLGYYRRARNLHAAAKVITERHHGELPPDFEAEIPKPTAKRSVPLVRVVFVVATRRDSVLLVRRTAGLHAGLYGLPGGELEPRESERSALRRHLAGLGVKAVVTEPLGPVRHAFSHLRWEGAAFRCSVRGTPRGAEWVEQDRLAILPLVPFQRRLLNQAMDRATNAQRRTTDAVFGTKADVARGKPDNPRASHLPHRG